MTESSAQKGNSEKEQEEGKATSPTLCKGNHEIATPTHSNVAPPQTEQTHDKDEGESHHQELKSPAPVTPTPRKEHHFNKDLKTAIDGTPLQNDALTPVRRSQRIQEKRRLSAME